MSIKIQMLDDTQEAFEVPVSWGCFRKLKCVGSLWPREVHLIHVSVTRGGRKRVCVFCSCALPSSPLICSGLERSSF